MADLRSDLPESITPATFDALPDLPAIGELKSRRQWVSWKYENRGGSKPTKPPIAPRTGFGASHSKPETWGSYDEAVTRTQRSRLEGVGYVLSPDDGLTGADLDNCYDPQSGCIDAWAQAIIDLHETYAEFSPSGTGLRIIWRGKVEKAIKADAVNVEVYGTQRYLTITGWHLGGFTPKDIRPAPKTLALLQARVLAAKPVAPPTMLPARIEPAYSLPVPSGDRFFRDINTAALASLSTWVPALYPSARLQPGTGAYRVSSRALGRNLQEDLSISPEGIVDFGVADMGDAREGKRTPISIYMEVHGCDVKEAAFWLCDRMGRTPESFGWHERRGREVVSTDGILHDAETGEIIEPDIPEPDKDYAGLIDVPGLVGDIARWVLDTARRPQPVLALGTALTIVGTAAGRHLAGPTLSGTHLYIIGLARTSYGKDHALKCISRILEPSKMIQHLGPDEFVSMPAVINFLQRSPLSICAMDEFGAFLKRINNKRASGFEMSISKTLRSAWGASFSTMMTPEWAGRTAQPIASPAMSIYAMSTPEEFYDSLTSLDVSNGILNRFLVIEAKTKPLDRDPLVDPSIVPEGITQLLDRIYMRRGVGFSAFLNRSDVGPTHEKVSWPLAVQDTFRAFSNSIDAEGERYPERTNFLARTAEQAVRLATIRAIGINPERPEITAEDLGWGIQFARMSADLMIAGAAEHMSENEHQANTKMVTSIIRKAGKLSRNELVRKLNGKLENRAFDGIMKMIEEGGAVEKLVEEPGKKGGPRKTIYVYRKPAE